MTDFSTRYATSDDVVSREVGGEFVLLHLNTGTYFGLNAVGSRVWQLIEAEELSLNDICDRMEEEFEVERSQLDADVKALVADLLANDLLVALA